MSRQKQVESCRGVYVLIIRVSENVAVRVGALGELAFNKGLYAYVGSAQNGLEQRIKRHLRKDKRKFWHVDYLLESDAASIVQVFCKETDKAGECQVAAEISKRADATSGFGCSDCRCRSHLFRVADFEFLAESLQVLKICRAEFGKLF